MACLFDTWKLGHPRASKLRIMAKPPASAHVLNNLAKTPAQRPPSTQRPSSAPISQYLILARDRAKSPPDPAFNAVVRIEQSPIARGVCEGADETGHGKGDGLLTRGGSMLNCTIASANSHT